MSDCFDSQVCVNLDEPLSLFLFILVLNDISKELDIDTNTGNINQEIIDLFFFFLKKNHLSFRR